MKGRKYNSEEEVIQAIIDSAKLCRSFSERGRLDEEEEIYLDALKEAKEMGVPDSILMKLPKPYDGNFGGFE